MNPSVPRQTSVLPSLVAAVAFCSVFLAGCNKNPEIATQGPVKVRVGYIGLTCEAPIFVAVEQGYFKEEGLDVSLVKCEWAKNSYVLALGGFDVTMHLVMYFLK